VYYIKQGLKGEILSMKVKLKLFATLRDYLPEDNDGHSCTLELPDNTAVNDVLNQIQIPKDIPKIVLINGLQKSPEEKLKDGDTLSVFPPVAGG
jgi:sulfur carrier protein